MPSLTSTARRHGVEVVDPHTVTLRCAGCSRCWEPVLGAGGRLPARWWACPNGCEPAE